MCLSLQKLHYYVKQIKMKTFEIIFLIVKNNQITTHNVKMKVILLYIFTSHNSNDYPNSKSTLICYFVYCSSDNDYEIQTPQGIFVSSVGEI